VRVTPNREDFLRIVTALCVEQSEELLSGTQYLDMSHLEAREDAVLRKTPATDPEEGDRVATPTSGQRRSKEKQNWGLASSQVCDRLPSRLANEPARSRPPIRKKRRTHVGHMNPSGEEWPWVGAM
jgi:hypothetical protein